MVGNGRPERALLHGGQVSPPPDPGCSRANRCPEGVHEDDLTYWPAGGLALWPDLVVDTHFSERAREIRLLRLLHDGGARFGLGVDETSALHLRLLKTGEWQAEALGEHGAWLFDAGDPVRRCAVDTSSISAHVLYLPSGSKARIDAQGMVRIDDIPAAGEGRRPKPVLDPLQDGALRAAIAGLREADSVQGRVRNGRLRADVILQRDGDATQLRIEGLTAKPGGCG
jgi:hypothetical protein